MDAYQQHILTAPLADVGLLSQQLPLDGVAYHLQESVLTLPPPPESGTFESGFTNPFDNVCQQPDVRSYSCGSTSSQPLSPGIQNAHRGISAPQVTNLPLNNAAEEISPNASRKESDDENIRTERRRAQNRAAQRAYRQRKDVGLKQREREIKLLREELDKAQRVNKILCKVISVLRERLKETPGAADRDDS